MKLEDLLVEAEQHNASDLLISPGSPPALREAGLIRFIGSQRLTAEQAEALIREVVGKTEWEKLQTTRELDFPAVHMGHRLRGNAYWRDGAPALALRMIPHAIPTPEQLTLPHVLVDLIQETQGMLLFTGAAGQGKTTSVASLLDYLNRHVSRHIVTVEDPIEFVHASRTSIVDQREVGFDTTSFAEALRHAMRQNPDAIFIGEMRDLETMKAALVVAETGHLVVSTLHANDACQAVDRIVYAFPDGMQPHIRAQLSMVLLAIANQRLVRSKSGRLMLALELLLNNPAVARLIREGKTAQLYGAMEIDRQRGVQTMNEALDALVKRGVVAPTEAARYLSRYESRSER
jgi:twitching motility protein PilT